MFVVWKLDPNFYYHPIENEILCLRNLGKIICRPTFLLSFVNIYFVIPRTLCTVGIQCYFEIVYFLFYLQNSKR